MKRGRRKRENSAFLAPREEKFFTKCFSFPDPYTVLQPCTSGIDLPADLLAALMCRAPWSMVRKVVCCYSETMFLVAPSLPRPCLVFFSDSAIAISFSPQSSLALSPPSNLSPEDGRRPLSLSLSCRTFVLKTASIPCLFAPEF